MNKTQEYILAESGVSVGLRVAEAVRIATQERVVRIQLDDSGEDAMVQRELEMISGAFGFVWIEENNYVGYLICTDAVKEV